METVHATCVAVGGVGVLIRGGSGAGKSDLALRLIDEGAQLISDDYTNLMKKGGDLLASPPPKIAGRMEVRGLGIEKFPYASGVRLGLIVDLAPGEEVERLPETAYESIAGIEVRRIALDPFEASTPAKVRLAVLGKPS